MKTEQDTAQYLLDQVARLTAENAMLKEKWLAQPEHTEQEPIAWMNDSGGCFLSDGNKYSENWTALYTSPPKREPLGLEIMDVCGSEDYREGFKDGVLYAEKCHDIGGGE